MQLTFVIDVVVIVVIVVVVGLTAFPTNGTPRSACSILSADRLSGRGRARGVMSNELLTIQYDPLISLWDLIPYVQIHLFPPADRPI
jgi:hypothetical protein